MTTVRVEASGSYDVLIGSGLLPSLGERIRAVTTAESVMLVCGDIVEGLYADAVQRSIEAAGMRAFRFVYPHGEASKTPETYISLLNSMAERSLTRTDCVVALGGGVTGDLSGFAAATYQRGISYVQVPTTLLAAVDSSVGGKTAIDLPFGKNLAGAFHQPRLVLCDCDTLGTLPAEVLGEGFAEVIKYGVIYDAEFFAALKNPIRPDLESVIARCVEIKRDIVSRDEFDTGIRAVLNFGHTVAHAIEKCSCFTVPHGRAVAAGMAVITKAAYLAGICDKSCVDGVFEILKSYSLPTSTEYPSDALLSAMLGDKKRSGGDITLILPERIGRVATEKMPVAEAQALLRPALEDRSWT